MSDDELVARVGAGDKQAFASLYERHVDAARAYARVLVGSWQQVDDLVAEAFVKIFDRMTVGGGRVSAFRAYLIATVRTTFYKRNVVEKRYSQWDEFSDIPSDDQDMAERAVDKLDFQLAAKAFASLPERWQQVLWMLEVRQESTEAIGEVLGIKANAVSALAFRARDGLRLAYLQLHIGGKRPAECRKPAGELAQWLCGRLGRAERARISLHVEGCAPCAEAVRELSDLLDQMHRFVPAVSRGTTEPRQPRDHGRATRRVRGMTGLSVIALAAGFALMWSMQMVSPVVADIMGGSTFAAGGGTAAEDAHGHAQPVADVSQVAAQPVVNVADSRPTVRSKAVWRVVVPAPVAAAVAPVEVAASPQVSAAQVATGPQSVVQTPPDTPVEPAAPAPEDTGTGRPAPEPSSGDEGDSGESGSGGGRSGGGRSGDGVLAAASDTIIAETKSRLPVGVSALTVQGYVTLAVAA
ncbi:sigma-70 family RNA polymerase sigma factor [Lentzea aerocolonigenes]|uniref:sigma-70 family RNA polymerase sigma factor n=1 Tax=Lentzea aerocolonigenes TaxID=68170 RepID=UPI0006980D0A|nr:sigma-70 family RNA polymerase sigma factor [Lentzea aerocolonigenes]